MKLANAIKKMETLGTVEHNERNRQYSVVSNGYTLTVSYERETERAHTFHTCRVGLEADSQTDYFPGTYWDNITKAIRFMTR